MFEQVADAIVVCYRQGRIIRASAASTQLCGANPLRAPFDEAFPLTLADSDSRAGEGIASCALRGVTFNAAPARMQCRQGRSAELLVSAARLHGSDDRTIGCVITMVDVSEHRRAEQALHQIEERFQMAVRATNDAIWDWDLNVSRITRGKLELRREPVALTAIVEQALETARPHLGHELIVSLPPDPIYLYADALRLAQLFSNLLNNAAKYTEKGGRISVSAARHEDDVLVTVADTGVGIAAEHLPHAFEMFSQATPALDRASSGLGIGLAVVKGLAELHGGTVTAHSEGPGEGSEFMVRLPVLAETPPAVPGKPGPAVRDSAAHRILVIEDNRDAANSLAMLLRLDGSEVQMAHDGVEGLAKARDYRPDVVLLDIGLPRLNGYEVCRALRSEPWGKDLAIVALTGWGQEADRRKSREAGFDGHLSKPVEYEELIAMFSAVLQRTGQ